VNRFIELHELLQLSSFSAKDYQCLALIPTAKLTYVII